MSCTQSVFPGFSFSLPTDTTITLRNICSTLDTVQDWWRLGNLLGIPESKWGKQEMVNYFVTNIPASWQLLAGALYYRSERTALQKVTSYFQRQPGMCERDSNRKSLIRTHWTGGCSAAWYCMCRKLSDSLQLWISSACYM